MAFDKRAFRESNAVRIGIFVGFLAAVAALFPRNKISSLSYEIGVTWLQDDVIAPFTFPIYKKDEVFEQEKKRRVRVSCPCSENKKKTLLHKSFIAILTVS